MQKVLRLGIRKLSIEFSKKAAKIIKKETFVLNQLKILETTTNYDENSECINYKIK